MIQKTLALLLAISLLVSCGGNSTPAPSTPRAGSNTPAAAPTQQLTPPGLPAGGFPLLDTPLDGQLVYSNGDGDIYTIEVRPNAKAKKVIGAPNDKGFTQEPAWSPDGQRIAYTYMLPFDTSGLPSADLMLASADGSDTQPLLAHQISGETFAMPTFAVDGRSVYFSHTTPILKDKQIVSATVKLERVDLQTKQVQTIADEGMQVAVNPDGKRIAFIKMDYDTFQQTLMTADVDGKGVAAVLPGNAMGGSLNSPRWTPDGKRILFAVPNFFAKNNQQTNWLVRLFDRLFDVRVAEAHGPPWDFWIVDADGKNLQRLTEIGEDTPSAAYSPDGKNFAFIGLAGIYVLDAHGKNIRWLNREGGHGRLDWKK